MSGPSSFHDGHHSAGCQIETILNAAVTIVLQWQTFTFGHFLAVHQAIFDFMSDMARKLYLGLGCHFEYSRSWGINHPSGPGARSLKDENEPFQALSEG
jgi:hypothetical protein